MEQKISNLLFRKISKDISNGRPLWSLLWANEYLAADDPLRKALAAHAGQALKKERYFAIQSIISKVKSGAKLNQFSLAQQMLLRKTREPTSQTKIVPHCAKPFSLLRQTRNKTNLRRQARALS